MKKYYILTLGCQKNEYDSEVMAGIVRQMGYEKTDRDCEADLIIMNTCCVRNKADVKLYGRLGQYEALKREKPELTIVIAGCLAQKDQKKLLSRFRHVDLVVGPRNLSRLRELLEETLADGKRRYACRMNEMEFENLPIERNSSFSAWVPISEGCDCFCTYCIVPHVRGPVCSRSPQQILSEIAAFAASGGLEITLLGQNVNSYGKDRPAYGNFAALLQQVNAVNGIRRIRFMSPHPANFDKELIDVMARLEHLCDHVHLPLQAGDDSVLRRMGRNYSRERYLDIVTYLREKIPGISVTTDIITGFPGETDGQFENTLDFVRNIGFNGAFMFAYSEREGTAAVKMKESVPPEIRMERLNRLIAMQNDITLEKHRQLEGETAEVLAETPSKKDPEFLTGKTTKRTVVNFRAPAELVGKEVTVRLTKGFTWGLMGELQE